MRVALAHDYLTQKGGAERVALLLAQCFPEAPLYTSVYEHGLTFPEFADVDVRPSFLQKLPFLRRDPRLAFPMLPIAWSSLNIEATDVVVASSTGWAHAVPTHPGSQLIVYCHNPARWLYQDKQYIASRSLRALWRPPRALLRKWDSAHAKRADKYLVNSSVVADRVRLAYGIHAEVVHPPVMVDPAGAQTPVAEISPGYWLVVARGRGYKNIETVINGTRGVDGQVVVVGASPSAVDTPAHVKNVGVVTDSELRWLYANARALVSVAYEDFGLTPLEANAFGTPVAVLRAGGFLDSTAEGVSGVFIEAPTEAAVRDALLDFPDFERAAVKRHADRFSRRAFENRLNEVVNDAVSNR